MRESRHNFDWSPHEAALRNLHAAGKTCSQIAALLGNGITRNAVIGKIHRLGLAGKTRDPGVSDKTTPRQRKRWTPGMPKMKLTPRSEADVTSDRVRAGKPLRQAKPPQNERLEKRRHFPRPALPKNPLDAFRQGYDGQKGRVSIADLQVHHCRFPIDMPTGAVNYCGLQKEENGSYCPPHAVRCSAGGMWA